MRDTGRDRPAHIVFYERAHGPVPAGLQLDHICRNRRCVNPDHLEPVTQAINVQRGAATKLTATAVYDIRTRFAAGGMTQTALAAEYGVTVQTVHNVVRGKTWRNLLLPSAHKPRSTA